MNDPDNFLSRWSRRKRGDEADTLPPEKSGEQSNSRAISPRDQSGQSVPVDKVALPAPPEFDVTSLPPIESIGAGTDISAFMQTGVPSALRHAALRRAWSTDPAIRDFMGPTENFWDAAGPDGIPGFGELDPGLDVKRMVSELFGETEREQAQPESVDPSHVAEATADNSEDRDNRDKAVTPETQQNAPHRTENGATQKESTRAQPVQKMTRRHGSAMPE
jgi:hypothetical protein